VTGDCHSAAAPSPKAVRSSRDRGCNGHRILRRALDDGRHPGSFRERSFHEERRRRSRRFFGLPTRANPHENEDARPKRSSRESGRGGRRRRIATGVSEARSHTAPWEENAHADCIEAETREVHSTCVVRRPAEAVTGVVKTPGPPVFTARSQSLRGVSTPRKRRTEPGTSEVWVHVIRLDGRNRFVASRVFSVGRSQGRSVARGR
jgi:hypothetical protein